MRADPSQPIVPGHEIVGVVDAVGDRVNTWQVGDRVGLGFLGGHDATCDWCRRGDFVNCENQPQTGTTVDGGYAEVVYARATGLVRIPDQLKSLEASPLLCAGITTFNALQALDIRPDALVGVQGIGGLGHLGVQYANKLGYRVVAIARGTEKASLATELGAHHYIDSAASRSRRRATGTRWRGRDHRDRRERCLHVAADRGPGAARSASRRGRGL